MMQSLVLNMDRLCQECFDLVIAESNEGSGRPQQQLGHQSLCVNCGISVAQRSERTSRPLPEGYPERAYIADAIFPRHLSGILVCATHIGNKPATESIILRIFLSLFLSMTII